MRRHHGALAAGVLFAAAVAAVLRAGRRRSDSTSDGVNECYRGAYSWHLAPTDAPDTEHVTMSKTELRANLDHVKDPALKRALLEEFHREDQ